MNSSVLITGVTAPTDFDLTHFDSYTQSNCQMDCYMNQMLDDCGCISGILGLSSGYRTCTPKMLYDCYGQISEDDIAGLIEDSYRECECRSLCKVVDYKTVISTVPFARTTKKALAQNRTTEQDDLSIVDIAFLEQGYIKIMQEKGTTFTQTLSDIGGQLGLFLGASCMSLFEFVEFFARLLYAHGYGPKRSIARKE